MIIQKYLSFGQLLESLNSVHTGTSVIAILVGLSKHRAQTAMGGLMGIGSLFLFGFGNGVGVKTCVSKILGNTQVVDISAGAEVSGSLSLIQRQVSQLEQTSVTLISDFIDSISVVGKSFFEGQVENFSVEVQFRVLQHVASSGGLHFIEVSQLIALTGGSSGISGFVIQKSVRIFGIDAFSGLFQEQLITSLSVLAVEFGLQFLIRIVQIFLNNSALDNIHVQGSVDQLLIESSSGQFLAGFSLSQRIQESLSPLEGFESISFEGDLSLLATVTDDESLKRQLFGFLLQTSNEFGVDLAGFSNIFGTFTG
mmetsp:Transcript_35111/g.39847  ORF Transcript_35111/g.39847 Transcript_35111/m.39847 type:complete len:311 (-) Transcript_35111:923-1855(-)